MPAEPLASFAALRNRLRVTGTLVTQTALRIGAGRDSSVIGNDLPVLRDSRGAPFIPGASLKGAFRARIEALVRAVVADGVGVDTLTPEDLSAAIADAKKDLKNPGQRQAAIDATVGKVRPAFAAYDFDQLEQRTRAVGTLKQQHPDLSDTQLSAAIWNQSTLIDLTFGSPELAGRLFFKDAQVDPALWFGQFEIRNGVALNRDTETVDQGKLYDYEVVPAGTSFDFALVLENAEEWQLGMITVALQPWVRGEVQIGGFRSRGLGYVQLQGMELRYVELHSVDDLLALLDSSGGDEPTAEKVRDWAGAFRTKLTQGKAAKEQGHA